MKRFCWFFLFISLTANAVPFTAVTSGNWNDGATWGNASPGSVGVDFPGAGNTAQIPGGLSITIPAAYTANVSSLTLNSNKSCNDVTLSLAAASSRLNVGSQLHMLEWDGSACLGLPVVHYGIINLIAGSILTVGDKFDATSRGSNGVGSYMQQVIIGSATMTVGGDITLASVTGDNTWSTFDMNYSNSVLNVGAGITVTASNWIPGDGTINYYGAAPQTIESSITYFNLGVTSASLKTLNGNTLVTGALDMTGGKINLNTYTMTLHDGSDYSTINYTSGWMYNGTLTRYMASGYAIGDPLGLFPLGSSTTDYRPFWISYNPPFEPIAILSVSHTAVYPATYNVASHTDGAFGTLQGVSQSTWNVTATNLAGTMDIRYGGQGFGTNVLTDLDASLAASVVGTYAAATGSATVPYVNRTGLSNANLNNSFRIGTKNITQSPLPVELISFNAEVNPNKKIDITWQTATEINNDYFTIERTKDGISFEMVDTLNAVGNSSALQNYYTIDESPSMGISYYRLKQTDINGQYSYSAMVAVNLEAIDIVNIYPNPSAGTELTVLIGAPGEGEILINTYNVLGENIISKKQIINKGMNSIRLDINGFSNGVYTFQVTDMQGHSFHTQKQFLVTLPQ
jgi:hypothetical protein